MNLKDAVNQFYFDLTLNDLRVMNQHQANSPLTYNSTLYLDILSYKNGCTASELAAWLHISKSAVTIKLNELLKNGLITKTPSETDKRSSILHVAPLLAEEYQYYDDALQRGVERVQQSYTEEQIEDFCAILNILRESYVEEDN